MKIYEKTEQCPAVMFNQRGEVAWEFDTVIGGLEAKAPRIEIADDDLNLQIQLIEAGAIFIEEVADGLAEEV